MKRLIALTAAALAAACSSKAPAETAALTPAFLETPIAARPAASAATVVRGKQLYDANCVQCHGAQGRGDGYGAPFLVPPPRDLTAGEFKFRTTSSGVLPTDDDLFRTISRGANGTGMPPWSYLLSDEERWALVDYVKTFDRRFAEPRNRNLKPMPLPDRPNGVSASRGKDVYAKMQCAKCHGDDGRGVGPASVSMLDSKNRHVNARDFTQPGSFRTGWTERELIRTMETGMNGVPMPSYSGAMSKQEEYDLIAYVMSLSKHSGDQKRRQAQSMAGVGKPDRVIALREHAWKYEPSEIRVKHGEVVRIDFSATDNGLGAGHGFALDGLDQAVFINGAQVGAPLSVTFKVDTPGRYNFYCATQCSTTELHPRMHGVLIVE